MDPQEKISTSQLPQSSSGNELASPFLDDELFSDVGLGEFEANNTHLESFQLESPFLSTFELPVSDELDESEIEEFEGYLDDEIDHPLEQAESYQDQDQELSNLKYSEQQVYYEDEAPYLEEEERGKNTVLPRMKFEFQTRNRIWRNDGRTPASLLGRKYGPNDFLVDKKKVRLESETKGVLEFETKWLRKWSGLEKAIKKAVEMTEAMNDSPPAKFEKSRQAFPFNVDHLRAGSAREKRRGFWGRRRGMEGGREKILGANEELEVEITGLKAWRAAIQSSECFLLHQYETYLRQHAEAATADAVVEKAEEIFEAIRPGNKPATQLVNLHSFLQIVVYYVRQGQRTRLKGDPSKYGFGLMSRTNFASIYRRLLSRDERRLFVKTVRQNEILNKMGLNRTTPFFFEGYGRKEHQPGPTVYNWLRGIYNGKDLLSARSGKGISASMGRYNVEARSGKKDIWLVKFETRGTITDRNRDVKEWLSYASELYIKASERRRRPVSWLLLPLGSKADRFLDLIAAANERAAISLAHTQGIIDENDLTNLVFHSYHPELVGRRIQKKERALARTWRQIRNDLVRPFLRSTGSHETMEFVGESRQEEAELAEGFVDESEYEEIKEFSADEEFDSDVDDFDAYADEEHMGERDAEAGAMDPDDEFGGEEAGGEDLDDSDPPIVPESALEVDPDASDPPIETEEDLETDPDEDFAWEELVDEDDETEWESEGFFEGETGNAKVEYDRALKHGLDNLDPAYFAHPWRAKRGRNRAGQFDTRFWQKGVDPTGHYLDKKGRPTKYRWGVLNLKAGADPYDALISIMSHQSQWSFDCATYVQAVHLYALAKSRGRSRINAYFATRKLRLRFHNSPGLSRKARYRRHTRNGTWNKFIRGQYRQINTTTARILQRTPFGSRVMWHNIKGTGDFINENTAKIAKNRYKGFPLFWSRPPVKGLKIAMGLAAYALNKSWAFRECIRTASVTKVKSNSALQKVYKYAQKNVYLREVTIYGPDPSI